MSKEKTFVKELVKAHYGKILMETELLLEYAKLRNESNLQRLIEELIEKARRCDE